MKIIAFGASNHRKSINKQLAVYAASLFKNAEVEILDLNDYEMPIYSIERQEKGFPEEANKFLEKVDSADLIIISFAEHNGSYAVAYKNLFDWASRIRMKVYENKPVLLLATSPGQGGAQSVLSSAVASFSLPYYGAKLLGSFSLPDFYDNFDEEKGQIINNEFDTKLKEILSHVSI
ncbi:MAG: NAD(P)H-dependent oxidoreductase [Flavobacteriaceae bacterium]|jgi:NAD(P)H-dependent FMN reductase|nr:NAD(P)H-dependent oxidoreductase [Flavobacteriaceae bacterium]